MLDKSKAQQHYEQIIDLAEKHQVKQELDSRISKLKNVIDNFSLNILTIGAFSAGKSALLNTLLQKDLLTEDQTPETAIATELKYCPIESFEIVYTDGTKSKMDIEQKHTITPDKVRHISYFMDNDFLKNYADYTFVDMPGFDSNINQHNQAIMQYIGRGNAYLLAIDCEDGAIKTSTIEFIEEIRHYNHNLVIAVTKSDKKTPSEVAKIAEKVKNQAEFIFGEEVPVVAVNKFDEETPNKIRQLLQSIDAQDIFNQSCMPLVEEIYDFLLVTVQQMANSNSFDSETFNQEIQKRQNLKRDLEEKLQNDRVKLKKKLQNSVLPGIMGDVESTLYSHSMDLAKAAMSSNNAFSSRVNSILRPVLIESTQRYTELSYSEFIQELNLEEMLQDKTGAITQDLTSKINQTMEVLKKIEQTKDMTDKLAKSYKVVTGVLAVVTSAVAPWLELIIIFLPEILKLFGVGSKQGQLDKVRSSIETDVIPKIIDKLRPVVKESLEEMEQQLVEDLEEKLVALISIEEEALKAAQHMKANEQEKYETLQKEFNETIQFITNQMDFVRGVEYAS